MSIINYIRLKLFFYKIFAVFYTIKLINLRFGEFVL